jgi:uncharacterized protein (DUF2236 family)
VTCFRYSCVKVYRRVLAELGGDAKFQVDKRAPRLNQHLGISLKHHCKSRKYIHKPLSRLQSPENFGSGRYYVKSQTLAMPWIALPIAKDLGSGETRRAPADALRPGRLRG